MLTPAHVVTLVKRIVRGKYSFYISSSMQIMHSRTRIMIDRIESNEIRFFPRL